MTTTVNVPICPRCNGGMIETFAFPGKEWACLPCGTTDTFFSVNPRGKFGAYEHQQKKAAWADDLHYLGMTLGRSAICARDVCKICADIANYKTTHYKTNPQTIRTARLS